MALQTTDVTPLIGTELKIDKATLLSGEQSDAIRELLRQRGVVFVRDANISEEEQLVVSHHLGKVQEQGNEGLQNISLDPEVSISADYLRGSFYWHIDGASDDTPNFAATLNPKKLIEPAAATYFANTYAAYDALSPEMKEKIDGLKVVHKLEMIQRLVYPDPTPEQLEDWKSYPQKIHPLVWTHTSGRKSLVMGATMSHVEGWDEEEGRKFLYDLQDEITRPQFVYRHEWTPGDVIIWDNTGTVHRVMPYDIASGRLMHRITLIGEERIQ